MGIETQPGNVYRLIVTLDGHIVEAVGCRFKRFEQAQARVAETVCRYAETEHVRAVAVQRGRPNAPVDRGGNGSPARVTLEDDDYTWTIEKRWGTDVIRRILLQNDIQPAPAADKPRLTANVRQRSPAGRAATARAGSPRPVSRHKSARGHLAATLAVIILATVALILFQTGGDPSRLLSAITGANPTIKDELPFDARTSFAPEPQPEPYEPGDGPTDKDARPREGTQP
ncbi:MAG: hypothetical protein KKI02_03180 [Planctomycetes bacterium]|nr:hypothetical protein [Planctomycetota bacterium]